MEEIESEEEEEEAVNAEEQEEENSDDEAVEDFPFETGREEAEKGKRFRHWVFTMNNWTEDGLDKLKANLDIAKTQYWVLGKEVGKTGTPHIQGTVCFANARTLKQVSRIITKSYLAPAIDVTKSITYCKKEGDFEESGVMPKAKGDCGGGAANKKRWDDTKALIKMNKIDDIDAQILICHYGNIKKMSNDINSNNAKLYRHDDRKFYYLCGPAGTGKSRKVRSMVHQFEDKLYEKNPDTKLWFDGINANHSLLLLEDISPAHSFLTTGLKLWMDAYKLRVEVKGDTRYLNFAGGFITSNWPLRSIVDAGDYAAVRRRVTMVWCPGDTGEVAPAGETWATMESLPRLHPHILRIIAEGPDSVYEPTPELGPQMTAEEARLALEGINENQEEESYAFFNIGQV